MEGCVDDLDALRLKDSVKADRERGIVVMNEETHWHSSIFQLPAHLAGPLADPHRVRMLGTVGQMHLAAPEFDEKQHVKCLQVDGFDSEEVASQHLLLVVLQESMPITPASDAIMKGLLAFPNAFW